MIQTELTPKNIGQDRTYPDNDIAMAKCFHEANTKLGSKLGYVAEAEAWYWYTGKRWKKDVGNLWVREQCKNFVEALARHVKSLNDVSEEGEKFSAYVEDLHDFPRRKRLITDTESVAPWSLTAFDRDSRLLNCQNGTYSLADMTFRPHDPADLITNLSRVHYDPEARCARWEQFISEIMCDDVETARFLQKSLAYAISGDMSRECFFVFYGNKTRNGKSTLLETIAYMLDSYARTIQPQTLARRTTDGAKPSPDLARLKGARLVRMPEPEKGLEINAGLVKQLTGGESCVARLLHRNLIEFRPEFNIVINANHLPRTSDPTIFESGRVKLIPFDRHFTPEEQDTGLKQQFRQEEAMSGIFNWLLEGYRLLQAEGLDLPDRVKTAIEGYRFGVDVIGTFIREVLTESPKNRIATSELHAVYEAWAIQNGYTPLSNKNFTPELRERHVVRRDGDTGNVLVGFAFK